MTKRLGGAYVTSRTAPSVRVSDRASGGFASFPNIRAPTGHHTRVTHDRRGSSVGFDDLHLGVTFAHRKLKVDIRASRSRKEVAAAISPSPEREFNAPYTTLSYCNLHETTTEEADWLLLSVRLASAIRSPRRRDSNKKRDSRAMPCNSRQSIRRSGLVLALSFSSPQEERSTARRYARTP